MTIKRQNAENRRIAGLQEGRKETQRLWKRLLMYDNIRVEIKSGQRWFESVFLSPLRLWSLHRYTADTSENNSIWG
jgi:hypothetical protein